MRNCLRCGTEMIEDLDVTPGLNYIGLRVTSGGIFGKSLGELSCALCPNCGYVEVYIDNLKNIKKI